MMAYMCEQITGKECDGCGDCTKENRKNAEREEDLYEAE